MGSINGTPIPFLMVTKKFVDVENFGADAYIDVMQSVLDEYGKISSDNVAVIVENCATNVSISNILNIPLVGCLAHRFNLAIHDYVESQNWTKTLDDVNKLMVHLQTPNMSLWLNKVTNVEPQKKNERRWSSSINMLTSLRKIVDAISDCSILIFH